MRFHAVGHRVLAVHADRICDGVDAAGGAFGERVPDKFRDRADAWRGVGQAFGQVLGIIAAVSLTWAADDSGWNGTTRFAMMVFALCLVVAGMATLLVLPFEGSSSYLPREDVKKGDYFSQYRPPKGAPKFFIAFPRACLPSQPLPALRFTSGILRRMVWVMFRRSPCLVCPERLRLCR